MQDNSQDAVLKVGEVCEVHGRVVMVRVDKNKNLSDLFFNGNIIKNISVGSFVEIRKDFVSLIGKIDGEKLIEEKIQSYSSNQSVVLYQRFLSISLVGSIKKDGKFIGGSTELPLIGNEAYVLTNDKISIVYSVGSSPTQNSISIAETQSEKIPISLPIDGLLNTHLAIFGNTGSGKSNTLTALFKAAYEQLEIGLGQQYFQQNCKFLIFDFNGEYVGPQCITEKKEVYELTTRTSDGRKIPLPGEGILDIEILSIISDATEKTQKPLLERALKNYLRAMSANNPVLYTREILRDRITKTLLLADRPRIITILGYFSSVFDGATDLQDDLEIWKDGAVKLRSQEAVGNGFINSADNANLSRTILFSKQAVFTLKNNRFDDYLTFVYLQFIHDLIINRVENDHVKPVLGKLKQRKKHIEKVINFTGGDIWNGKNFVVVSLDKVNLEIKKLIPLLIAKAIYSQKKASRDNESLNIIIDEAHNILSQESFRETESWKDYRLETFEEIIKEGRKFGTFLTISSQRPNDISHTITSQAHNYFIHRLVNERDLNSISKAVSYIDRITEESIPTLPTGVCIFSGIATQLPLKLKIYELDDKYKPDSKTFKFFSD